MSKIIFQKEYHGFEASVDIYRDVAEMLDPDFNEEAKDIKPEFSGTIEITVTYKE